jgi:hypothetical protein
LSIPAVINRSCCLDYFYRLLFFLIASFTSSHHYVECLFTFRPFPLFLFPQSSSTLLVRNDKNLFHSSSTLSNLVVSYFNVDSIVCCSCSFIPLFLRFAFLIWPWFLITFFSNLVREIFRQRFVWMERAGTAFRNLLKRDSNNEKKNIKKINVFISKFKESSPPLIIVFNSFHHIFSFSCVLAPLLTCAFRNLFL